MLPLTPYLVHHGSLDGYHLTYYFETRISSGLFINDEGRVVVWRGMPWERLATHDHQFVYSTGYTELLQNGKICLQALTTKYLTNQEGAEKIVSFYFKGIEARWVNFQELKEVLEQLNEENAF